MKSPVFLGCKKWFFQHHAKFFCSLRFFAIFVKTHFLIQYLIFKVFEKIMRLASKIFAWWKKISSCCKNLHPWFCSIENPHYWHLPFPWNPNFGLTPSWRSSDLWGVFEGPLYINFWKGLKNNHPRKKLFASISKNLKLSQFLFSFS